MNIHDMSFESNVLDDITVIKKVNKLMKLVINEKNEILKIFKNYLIIQNTW